MGVPSGPAGLLVTLGSNLVGHPSSQADHVSVVGPGTETGTTALALNATGLLQGINYRSEALGQSTSSDNVLDQDVPEEDEGLEPINGALTTPLRPAESRPDDLVLAESEWPTRIGDAVARWFTPPAASLPQSKAETAPAYVAERIPLQRDDSPSSEPEQVDQASLGMPLGLGLATVVALRLRQPIRRWLHRRRKAGALQVTAVRMPHTRI